MFAITIPTLQNLQAAIAAAPALIEAELQDAAEYALQGLALPLATYPPPPAGSRYKRTGELGDGWTQSQPTFALNATGFEATLTNPTAHGPYVEDADQRRSCMDAWPTIQAVMQAQEAVVQANLEDALQAAIQKI